MKAKPLSTKEYINLCIENYNNTVEENVKLENKSKAEELNIRSMNESLLDMQASKAAAKNKFQKFSENTKSMFLSECIYKILDAAMGIHMESTVNNNIKRGLINNFIQEHGVNSLLSRFKTTSFLLAEFSALVEKYHKIVMETAKADNPDSCCIDPEVKDKFFEELDIEDVDDVVGSIRSRVANAVEEFIQSNINNKVDIEDTIKAAQEKIENAKTEELKESYEILAKKKISNIKSRAIKNVFSEMVASMSKHILTEESFKNEYMSNNKIDMDKVVERCEILYTFLETLNTMKIVTVDEAYIKEVLDTMNA